MKKSTPPQSIYYFTLVAKESLFIIFFFLLQNFIYAQSPCFTTASIQEERVDCYGAATNYVLHTGSDMRNAIYSATTPSWMEVNVYDGDVPRLNCNPGTLCGTPDILLPSGAVDPDVALVDWGLWYAIVVYADANNGFKCICDLYEWSGSAFVQVRTCGFPYTLLNANGHTSHYYSAINVDADNNGNFCIVWDDIDGSVVDIMAQGGYIAKGGCLGTLALCGSPTSVSIAHGDFHSPDVSLKRRSCSTVSPYPCYSRAFITYVEKGTSSDILHVDGDDFEDWICGGGQYAFASSSLNAPSGAEFHYPRIACPLAISGTFDDEWTVVVEQDDASNTTYDIIGYTKPLGVTLPAAHNYTDGTVLNCRINRESNLNPVVAYDYATSNSTSGGIIAGWESEYSGSNLYPPEVISLIGLRDGSVDLGCSSNYLIVPSSYAGMGNGYSHTLSLSGRDAYNSPYSSASGDPIQYTFYYDGGNNDVYTKVVRYGSCSLRLRNIIDESDFKVFPNPFTDEINIDFPDLSNDIIYLSITDILGNIILNVSGIKSQINSKLRSVTHGIPGGMYYLKLSDNNSVSQIIKLIKI